MVIQLCIVSSNRPFAIEKETEKNIIIPCLQLQIGFTTPQSNKLYHLTLFISSNTNIKNIHATIVSSHIFPTAARYILCKLSAAPFLILKRLNNYTLLLPITPQWHAGVVIRRQTTEARIYTAALLYLYGQDMVIQLPHSHSLAHKHPFYRWFVY